MAEHIDRTCLTTSLRYRFDYISKILNFTRDDINILNTSAPILFPHIPFIVETIIKKLYSFDITKQYFILHIDNIENFSSNKETDFTVIPAPTDFRKDMLSIYLKRILLQSEWDDAFLQYLSHVGELHRDNKNLEVGNIDYIHINALLGYLQHLFIITIWKIDNLDTKKKYMIVRAINKLFWIQNTFLTMHHGISLKNNSVSNEIIGKTSKCPSK